MNVRPASAPSTRRLVVAVAYAPRRLGRVRLRRIRDASADSLDAFVKEAIDPGTVVHTDGWLGYDHLEAAGYRHKITFLADSSESPADLMPHVHLVVSFLKRWILGTHHGAVSLAHLDYYLDEFACRFNRRRSRHRGTLFFRLVQQAVHVAPAPYGTLVKHVRRSPVRRSRRRTHKI
jgi:transposase-like protein